MNRITATLNRHLSKTKNHTLYRFSEQVIRHGLKLRPDMPKDPKYKVSEADRLRIQDLILDKFR